MTTKIDLQLLEDNEIEWMLASSFSDALKSVFSSLEFLFGLGLGVVSYVALQANSFASLLGFSILGAVLAFICADRMSSWLRGWSPAWITVAVCRSNDKSFVVAKDRIGRKRIFMYGVMWSEVDGYLPNETLKIALDEIIRLNNQ